MSSIRSAIVVGATIAAVVLSAHSGPFDAQAAAPSSSTDAVDAVVAVGSGEE